jgi:hypothetical protein
MEQQNINNVEVKSSKSKYILIFLIILAAIAAGYFYDKYNKLSLNEATISENAINDLVKKVGKIIDLPVGESPVMATITDTTPLADNPFFANAKVGDQVLLYTVSRKAFLYDPVANIVVEVASLNIGQ